MTPMNPLQIQLFVGAAAGRRARFDASPISFGRDPSNALIVEDAFVSREHGEIRFEAGQWILVNRSANGTRVNRKQVTDKPVPLTSGDEVFVGDKLMFNVTIEPVEAGEATLAQGDAANLHARPARKPRSKLWMYIAGYMGFLLLIVIALSTMGKKKVNPQESIPEQTNAKIEEWVRLPLKRDIASQPKYQEHLAEAEKLFRKRQVKPSGLFEAYREYQLALSVSGRSDDTFPPEDALVQANFFVVRDELIVKVKELYGSAVNRLRRGDNEGAYWGFEELKTAFNDPQSPLYRNTQDLQNIATKRLPPGKRLKKT